MPAATRTPFIPFYPAPSPSRYASPHSHLTFPALRKFIQGAGSALLVFSGANSFTAETAAASAAPAVADFSSFEGILQTMVNGEFAGPAQIAAAVIVFLMAGQCVARFAGLVVAGIVIVLYLQGVTMADVGTFVEHFTQRLGAAGDAFLAAEVS